MKINTGWLVAVFIVLGSSQAVRAAENPPPSTAPDTGAHISFDDRALVIRSGDSTSSFTVSTLLQMDAAYFDDDGTSSGDGSEMRRAFLTLSGKHGPWSFKLQDNLTGSTTLMDAWGAWSGSLAVKVGNFKVPYSLDNQNAVKDLPFMERSLMAAFLPMRSPGIMVSSGGARYSWAVGAFGEPLKDASGSTPSADEEDQRGGVSARFTVAPLLRDNAVVHLGISLHYRKPGRAQSGADTLALYSGPEAHLAARLLDTGAIGGDVDDYQLAGLELASSWGPLLAQAEYTEARVARSQAADIDFSGGYVQLSWVFNGAQRQYRPGKGVFGGVGVDRGVAWELAARLSRLDLEDADVDGGEERNATLALNLYPAAAVKLSLNYVRVLSLDGGKDDGDEPSAVMLRAQLAL